MAGIIFFIAWHYAGEKAIESAFLKKDEMTGEEIWLNPQEVKKDIRSKISKSQKFFDSNDDSVLKRKPVEIAKTKFDLDS